MDSGSRRGGSLRLLELLQTYTGEFAYDFRSRFNLSYQEIGFNVSLLETAYLVGELLKDPSSHLQAAVNKWSQPVSREWTVLVNLYDLIARVNSGKQKPKPYPVPWPRDGANRIGRTLKATREQVIERLERMNPKEKDGS